MNCVKNIDILKHSNKQINHILNPPVFMSLIRTFCTKRENYFFKSYKNLNVIAKETKQLFLYLISLKQTVSVLKKHSLKALLIL